MARLLCYIHPHVSRYAQVDVPCRQTIIQRNRVELFFAAALKRYDTKSSTQYRPSAATKSEFRFQDLGFADT